MDQPPNHNPEPRPYCTRQPQPPPPFSCTYSPNLPELLQQMNVILATSTHQARHVILISPKTRHERILTPRTCSKHMGLAVKKNKMAVAETDEVVILTNAPGLAKDYHRQPGIYDAFYTPRDAFFTGLLDLHDLGWG